MSLQPPSLLAQLPRPLGGSAGKCQFSEVYSLTASRKRKRYEVAAAIDGESVNIYNVRYIILLWESTKLMVSKVQFPKLISSYAISPQSTIPCPPCSVREKSRVTASVKRYTYCAIDRPERQIKGFVEHGTSDRSSAEFSTLTFPLEDSKSPVVFTTVVPTIQSLKEQEEGFDVVIVHENGQVRRLSPDLKRQRWITTVTEYLGEYEVRASFVVSFEEAQKALLRKRQDLIATILAAGHGVRSEASTILMLVLHPRQRSTLLPSEVRVHLFSIPAHHSLNGFTINENQHLRHLMEMTLPDIQGQAPLDAQNVNWTANLNQAELSLSFDRGYITYNISHYTPEIDSHMIVNTATFSSVMRISPRLVIGASQSTVSLYDAKYRSLQADLPITEIPDITPSRTPDAPSSLELISYFSTLSVVVALCRNNLLAFDLSTVHNSGQTSRKRPRSGLLIDSIGKGIGVVDTDAKRPSLDRKPVQFMRPLGLTQNGVAAKWADVRSELDLASEANDPMRFDQIMKTKFWKSLLPDAAEKLKGFPPAREYIDLEKISFLLSKIFSLVSKSESDTPKLTISFLPFETLQWLVNSRHLSLSSIQAALSSSNPDRLLPTIPAGSLVKALAHSGRSIKLLLLVLRGPVHLDAMELSHTLRLLLEVARSHSTNSAEPPKALTEPSHNQNQSTTKEAASASTTPKQTRGSEAVLTDAVAGLNLTLIKLDSQPLDKVTQSIRSVLSNSDILSIIHHLRHSLATGGYTSRFTEDPPPSFSSPKIPVLPLSTIVDLFNACIDAVGPSGWISAAGFAGGEGSEASLIADMKSEISAALAGVEEATYLKGILREFIRCCETTESAAESKTHSGGEKKKGEVLPPSEAGGEEGRGGLRIKRKEWVNGAQILVYDDMAHSSGLVGADSKMLPLSLMMTATGRGGDVAGEEPSRTKVVKSTGEVKPRSHRELGYLKGKAVGKYSFERIIV
ncbi:hypothetical protein PRK78_006631 [Emydomyces testavorans]|uniref:Uncharacterized protein n=1 Tax=Emydomyces testavorans TaxID=2070801 RepID=A0AAF0DLQ5_9EURO|nr:hypothetical protein PRK78_006631 [Emydomyces testavorans]